MERAKRERLEQEAEGIVRGVTEEEYYSQNGDSRWQYLGGDLVKEPVSFVHDDINSFLIILLREYASERSCGVVMGSRFPMRLDPKWSPEPDVMVVSAPRRHLITPLRLEGPADLAIEILSPSHPEITLRRKLPRYRQAQVLEIWIIDPDAKSLRADRLTPDGYQTRILTSGRLTTEALPGFWLDVAWLWQRPLPSALSCLHQILA